MIPIGRSLEINDATEGELRFAALAQSIAQQVSGRSLEEAEALLWHAGQLVRQFAVVTAPTPTKAASQPATEGQS